MLAQFLASLMAKKQAGPFLEPVDPVALEIPDYFTIIKHPLDLGTIRTRLKAGLYDSDASKFFLDLDLVWTNCQTYNPESLLIHKHSLELQKLCRRFEAQFWGSGIPNSRMSALSQFAPRPAQPLKRARSQTIDSPRHQRGLPTGSKSDGTLREPTFEERERFTRKLWRLISADQAEASKLLNLISDRQGKSCISQNRANPERFLLNVESMSDELFWEAYHLA